MPATARRLWLHERISDRPHVPRRPRPAHLWRHQRDHEGADRALACRAASDQTKEQENGRRLSSTTPCARRAARGKKDGSLHEVPAVRLGAKVLEALRDRNGLDTGDGRRHHLRLRRSGRRGGLGHPARRRLRGRLRHQGAGHADLALLRLGPRRHQFRRRQDRPGRRRDRHRRRRRIDVAASAWACRAAPGSWTPRSACPAGSCRRASRPT